MIVDLLILAAIGCILEALCTKLVGFVFLCVPTATISLLILLVAVARWKLWGLVLAPLLALSTIIGGKMNSFPYFAAAYDWKAYLSIFIGLLVVGFDVIFYRKGTKKTTGVGWKLILIIIMNYILYGIIQFIIYRLLTGDHFIYQGRVEFPHVDPETNEVVVENLCFYIESGYIYNLFGLAATMVGAFILRSQGVINNVVEKLVDDKKQAELDKLDEENFTIEELPETQQIEDSSGDTTEDSQK